MVRENSALRRLYYRMQILRAKSQSDEAQIIERLSANAPKTFVEFGFHPIQFNCIALAKKPDWQGLLIDGNAQQVADARALYPERIRAVEQILTLETLDFIPRAFQRIGVLSIDVDGNDYWFLKALIKTQADVISVEYNSTFGLEPVSVPYDPTFDRHQKHPSGWYHGASLTALCKLCATHGYGLAAVSENGANAFFTARGNLDPLAAWRPNTFRERHSGVSQVVQWQNISGLPLVRV